MYMKKILISLICSLVCYTSLAANVIPKIDDGSGFVKLMTTNDVLVNVSGIKYLLEGDVVNDPLGSNSWAWIQSNSNSIANIINTTSNWDTAYGWGDHSTNGYLTSFSETDPFFTNWLATANVANWNIAYGWGNHATNGYLTAIPVTNTTTTKMLAQVDFPNGIIIAEVVASAGTFTRIYLGSTNCYVQAQGTTNFLFTAGTNSANKIGRASCRERV